MKTMIKGAKRKFAPRMLPSGYVRDLIPSADRIDRILPLLRQSLTMPICRRCRGFKHHGACPMVRDS